MVPELGILSQGRISAVTPNRGGEVMRQTLGAIIAVSFLASGCASVQETRMFNGPFGRTEVGAVVIAADPSASKVLVQAYDGDLWIYDVDSAVRGRLSALRVGDEVILAFDDRIAGKRAIALDVVPPGRRPLPPGMLSAAAVLPMGVVFGAPATTPAGNIMMAGSTGVFTGPGSGTVFANGAPIVAGPGVFVPGFGSFSALPAGVVAPSTALGLGLMPGTLTPLGPMGGPSVARTGGVLPGRTPLSQGNFTPGTIAPGVTTANPNAPGSPVVQGPFTPGTVAPGVSQQRGNAPPPSAGATTTGAAPAAPTPRAGMTGGAAPAPTTAAPTQAGPRPAGMAAPSPQRPN
jgi:hypothetical protein